MSIIGQNIWQTVRKGFTVHKKCSLTSLKSLKAAIPGRPLTPPTAKKTSTEENLKCIRLQQRRGAVELQSFDSDFTFKNGELVLWIDLLSEEEMDVLKEAFAMYDKGNNGQVKRKAFNAILKTVGKLPTEDELTEFFHEADIDNSGVIEFPEFATFMAKHRSDSEDELRLVFDVFDKDGDNLISHEELKAFTENIGEDVEDGCFKEVLKEFAHDENGYITYEEFVNTMRYSLGD